MKKTALNAKHIALGAKMVPFAGFEMPVQYSGVNQEHMVVREKVGVFDVSHMGQFRIKGEKALDLVQKITSNDASKLKVNQAQYSCMPNEKGGIVDDLIVYKIADDEYFLVVNAGCLDKDWEWVNKQNEFGCEITNESDDTSLLAVQGPKATEAMQSLTDVNLAEIPFYHFQIGKFAGVDNVIISATGYTGSGGFEIYFPNEYADLMWDKVMEAGKEYGIEPCGLAARDTLRLEKGYCLYGNDISMETSPLEAGLGWITKFTKDFIASDILKKQKEEGVSRKLVAFKMVDRGIPRHDYEIVDAEGNNIGKVTSGTQSPILKEGIGLGYVQKAFSKVGSEIYIQVRNKRLKAEVVKLPFV
ncbi:glycine cleavage system aminomethyltransferase GcvT [Ornithobacterium rhinotracheale]|uniref:glycine cleavage system aminomethyltransferase GcvT n=1 Tax=Ornithobacterium rhinotracheale TaxID=28251 RepID=UPI001FF14BE6|nr:glycine cleavage system aminomethyltransferase GcvT [Ornithobacterium rhinotracheale]MCK0200899.1 glycine cleavage system aminomethyltransferase GcvT [Ornithobacterium rhinotracheale]UVD87251.1 glycine cleavage system aminomethyltransferase GcvT [Ornithobacterium rhinotracheale]